MKKINLFVILALFLANCHAQHVSGGGILNIYFGKNFKPAEIKYADGSVKKGLVKGFIENNTLEFADFSAFDSFEGHLNLDDKSFFFKENESSDEQKLTQAGISEISLFENGTKKTYRLLNILSVRNGKEIVDLKRPVWLPLLAREENVSIYGFNLFVNEKFIMTQAYLSKDNINAIKPFDKMVGMKTVTEAYKVMLNYVFDGCEKMAPSVNGFMEKAKQEYKNGDEKIKEMKKDKSLDKKQKAEKELLLNQSKIVDPFVAIIKEYNDVCK